MFLILLTILLTYFVGCGATMIGQLKSNDQELQEWIANGLMWPLYWAPRLAVGVSDYLSRRKALPSPDPYYLEGLKEVEDMLHGENLKPRPITQYEDEDVKPFDIQVGGASSIRMVGDGKVLTTDEVIDTTALKDFLNTPIPPRKIEGL